MFWLFYYVAVLTDVVHVAQNMMPHTAEYKITSGITDFFINYEDNCHDFLFNMFLLWSVKQYGPKAGGMYFQQKFGRWYSMFY
jgi:hemerythrin-like domain-containing protein